MMLGQKIPNIIYIKHFLQVVMQSHQAHIHKPLYTILSPGTVPVTVPIWHENTWTCVEIHEFQICFKPLQNGHLWAFMEIWGIMKIRPSDFDTRFHFRFISLFRQNVCRVIPFEVLPHIVTISISSRKLRNVVKINSTCEKL